ncbi:MAG: SCP-like extracellular, partial [Clostridiales bacterium]|nr:SCP-like extracellular [Clostridiales bacterium]
MKKKSSIIVSCAAACAIFVSAFAFSGFAVEDTKAVQQQAANVAQPTVTTLQTAAKETPVKETAKNATQNLKATPVSTKSSDCPLTEQSQNKNKADIKKQVQSALGNKNINSDITNKLQTILNNINCDETTAKNTNNSAIRAKLDSILKSIGATAPCTKEPTTTPSTSTKAPATATTSKPSTSTATTGDYSAFQKKVV